MSRWRVWIQLKGGRLLTIVFRKRSCIIVYRAVLAVVGSRVHTGWHVACVAAAKASSLRWQFGGGTVFQFTLVAEAKAALPDSPIYAQLTLVVEAVVGVLLAVPAAFSTARGVPALVSLAELGFAHNLVLASLARVARAEPRILGSHGSPAVLVMASNTFLGYR